MKLEIEFSGNNQVLIQKSAGQCLLHSSSLKLQQQLYLEIVSSKVQEDTQLKWVSGGISLSPMRL